MTKPNLDVSLYQNYRAADGTIDSNRIELKNNGIGPAIIKKVTVMASGVIVSEKEAFISAAQEIFNTLLDDRFVGSTIHAGEYLSAGDSIPLLRVRNLEIAPEQANAIIEEKLQILIEYSSVYGENDLYNFNETHCVKGAG